MPVPPTSFTKTKWLTFFAELTAKITHHNSLVVMEGCEVIKRLLVSRVSIAAFLEEGNLLQHLLDIMEGAIPTHGRSPTPIDDELLFVELQTLSLCIDMMTALHADGDEYYCLLVMARAGVVLDSLTRMVRRVHTYYFGIFCGLIQSLLSMPIGRPCAELPLNAAGGKETKSVVDTMMFEPRAVALEANNSTEGNTQHPIALARHLSQLQSSIRSHVGLLREMEGVFTALVAGLEADAPKRLAALLLLRLTSQRLKRATVQGGKVGDQSRNMGSKFSKGTTASPKHVPLVSQNKKGDVLLTGTDRVTVDGSSAKISEIDSSKEVSAKMREQTNLSREDPNNKNNNNNNNDDDDTPQELEQSRTALSDAGASRRTDDVGNDCETPRTTECDDSGELSRMGSKPAGLNSSHWNNSTQLHSRSSASKSIARQSTSYNDTTIALDYSNISFATSGESARGAATMHPGHDIGNMLEDSLSQWEIDWDDSASEEEQADLSGGLTPKANSERAFRSVGDSPTPGKTQGNPEPTVKRGTIRELFVRMRDCGNHEEFFSTMNDLWCVTVAAGKKVSNAFGMEELESFYRFLEAAPENRRDTVLFTYILLWLTRMMSMYQLREDVLDALLTEPSEAVIVYLGSEVQKREMQQLREGEERHVTDQGSMYQTGSTSLSYDPRVSARLEQQRPKHASPSLERPSIAFVLLSFLLNAERACQPKHIIQWVKSSGLLSKLDAVIRRVENVQSVLLDAPTTMDGALSDEVYLGCALACSTKSEDYVLAVLGCKLLSSIILDHHTTLDRSLVPETSTMLQTAIPLLFKISIHNPTLTSATENVSASAIHHMPACQRSSRHTSLGECSLVALDSCIWLVSTLQLECVQLKDVVNALPSLSRSTRRSIHPPLRAAVYRFLTRLCTTPAHLVLVVRDMPSIINVAVTSVLEYSTGSPQWESAAAAEWIRHVICVAATDSSVERSFNFAQTALPMRLLQLAASNGISYATASLMALVTELFEQQQRFAAHFNERSNSVLLPHGRRTSETWTHLIKISTHANVKLTHMCRSIVPVTTATKDTMSRAVNALEVFMTQFAFLASVARSIFQLVTTHPEYRTGSSSGISHSVFYGFLESVLAVPSPHDICSALSLRFSVSLGNNESLRRTYEDMLQWALELSSVWFSNPDEPNVPVATFPSLPDTIFENSIRLMADASISQNTRCQLSHLLCCLLSVSAVRDSAVKTFSQLKYNQSLRDGMEKHSARIFEASLLLKDLSCVQGLRARLVSTFLPANKAAHSGGWFAARVVELDKMMRMLRDRGGVLDTYGKEALATVLSLVSSTLAHPQCPPVPSEPRQLIACAFASGLHYDATQLMFLKVSRTLAGSPEGRRVMLHETHLSGDPSCRTCFGRIIQLTFFVDEKSITSATFSTYTNRSQQPSVSGGGLNGSPLLAAAKANGGGGGGGGAKAIAAIPLPTLPHPRGAVRGRVVPISLSPSISPQRERSFSKMAGKRSNSANGVSASKVQGAAEASLGGGLSGDRERDVARTTLLQIGMDVCSTACTKGGEAFAHMILKLKVIDAVEQLFVRYDRQRPDKLLLLTRSPAAYPASTASSGGPIPIGLCRLIAALSFSAEVQPVIVQHQELFDILVETAGYSTDRGTLALLALRNLCFNAALKTQLCQDSRVLLVLKASVMALPSVDLLTRTMESGEQANGNFAGAVRSDSDDLFGAFTAYREKQLRQQWQNDPYTIEGNVSTADESLTRYTGATALSLHEFLQRSGKSAAKQSKTQSVDATSTLPSHVEKELLRRQQLSVTALWSLMYDHQRGKAYIRGLLNQAPAIHVGNAMILPLHGVFGSEKGVSQRQVPSSTTTTATTGGASGGGGGPGVRFALATENILPTTDRAIHNTTVGQPQQNMPRLPLSVPRLHDSDASKKPVEKLSRLGQKSMMQDITNEPTMRSDTANGIGMGISGGEKSSGDARNGGSGFTSRGGITSELLNDVPPFFSLYHAQMKEGIQHLQILSDGRLSIE